MDMDCPSTADLVERLKRHGVALGTIEVTGSDGKPIAVAVPRVRTKWARLRRVLDEMRWRVVRALDTSGALLETFELLGGDDDDVAGDDELEALPDELDITFRFAERSVQLALKAQTTALAPYVKSQSIMLEGMAKLVGVLTDRLVQLERMFGRTLALAHDSATTGEADGGSGEAIMAMLMQVMAAQRAQAQAAAAKPPNGAP
jgi:hypothetical protein